MLELFTWLVITLLSEPQTTRQEQTPRQEPATRQEEFIGTVQPILERRCQPCHFPGGVMHEKLPFDRAETVDKLGTKLFTRIKNEEERETIRKFLATRAR